jgi:tRNA U54 and U55 pseudouridine synthase Pus10
VLPACRNSTQEWMRRLQLLVDPLVEEAEYSSTTFGRTTPQHTQKRQKASVNSTTIEHQHQHEWNRRHGKPEAAPLGWHTI